MCTYDTDAPLAKYRKEDYFVKIHVKTLKGDLDLELTRVKNELYTLLHHSEHL